MGAVIFNSRSSEDYGIQVEHPPGYSYPERDYEVTHVPGRNGDIVLDKGSYKNVEREYEIAIGSTEEDFVNMANRIAEWLHSSSGYARLEDSYEPEYYRMALYEEDGEIENILFHAGEVKIKFNCKPQRFLKQGEKSVSFEKEGVLLNPTGFSSLPYIVAKGTGEGTITIGDYTVTISEVNEETVIDSEIQDCYSGSDNRNSYVTLSNGFPKLITGLNSISFSGGITSVEVTPRWWTL